MSFEDSGILGDVMDDGAQSNISEMSFRCPWCQSTMTVNYREQLPLAKEVHDDMSPICAALEAELRKYRSISDEAEKRYYTCPVCSSLQPSWTALKYHLPACSNKSSSSSSSPMVECEHCGSKMNQTNLIRHLSSLVKRVSRAERVK